MTERHSECARFEDELIALALGTVTGRARAEVIAHVEVCPHCWGELEALSETTDRLLQLVPEREPPLGFEVRVLARIGAARHARFASWRRRTAVLVGAAAVLAGVVGFVAGHGIGSAPPGTSPKAVTVALHTSSRTVGELSVPMSGTPRLVVRISGLGMTGPVTCRVTATDGRTATVGVFWLYHGSGTWSAKLPFAADDLRSATITSSSGSVLARATVS